MLKYIGDGAWLPGIPARDLSDQEVIELGGEEPLLQSRIYQKPDAAVINQPLSETREVNDGSR